MSTWAAIASAANSRQPARVTSKLVAVPDITMLAIASKASAPKAAQQNTVLQYGSTRKTSPSTQSIPKTPSLTSAATLSPASPKQQKSKNYDVYAAPFVPAEWRKINTERPIHTIKTESRHQFNPSVYASTFAGTDFVYERISPTKVEAWPPSNLVELNPNSYLSYFTKLWRIECTAKEQENEEHALYKQILHDRTHFIEESIWELTVPGIREDNPLLETGDVLHLRQLWIDGNMDIMQVQTWTEDAEHGKGAVLSYKSWTQVQYDACVYSVNRAKEVVYLKAKGLAPLNAGYNVVPVVVNVNFPLKHVQLRNQQRALISIDLELSKTRSHVLHTVPSPSDQEHVNDISHCVEAEASPTAKTNDWIRRVLFPTEEDGQLQTRLRKVPHRDLFDHAINYEQAHAVNSICTNDYGVLPYLISGPPGTGKTKTLVEIAMQLLHTTEVAHMLICAPSEAAADTLALRLKQYLSLKQLLRLNRSGRAENEVPQELMPYCHITNGIFDLPPFRTLMAYNIVVTSCQDAGILMDTRLTNDDLWEIERNAFAAFHPEDQVPIPTLHWSALLIDEAAQATEMDLLAAISVVCPPSIYPTNLLQPRFVMAGDENQLGPRTSSRDPRFSMSLFARLFDRPLYKTHPLSRSNMKLSSGPPVLKKYMLPINYPPFANLIRNYRSHPAILSVPSSLFYNDTLIPEAPTPPTPHQSSSLWRGRKWPILFLPHSKPDEIERDGGGWYNLSEAQLACSIAQALVQNSEVLQTDICIMSPFAAQVKLLRSLIRGRMFGGGSGLWDVNIGPLEAFQGLENRVVILCTTRTRQRFLKEDEKRGLGIVHQKRRMNVALTRAKEALFVIGNPAILAEDECWRQWLAFCWRNGLVSDPDGVWSPGEEVLKGGKVGVLERALVAKEDHCRGKKGKMLGGAATMLEMNRDYELWVERLREALDEENEDGEDEEDEEASSAETEDDELSETG
jgi:helicase MOV-10